MDTFLDLVIAAARDESDTRPIPDAALAAILLDRTQLTPERLLSGLHVIRTGDQALVGDVVGVIRTSVDGQRSVKGAKQCALPGYCAADLVVVNGAESPRQQHDALVQASLHGAALVGVVAKIDELHADIVALADHFALPPVSARDFEDVVQACTGDDIDCDFDGVILPRDVVVCVAPETTGQGCLDNLDRLTTSRDKARAGDIFELIKSLDAEPLGDVAGRVVTRLRDLHCYGPAKDWGLRLASDLRDYRNGSLSWDDVDKGILLSGSPGCGKTFFARALAAECGCELVVTTYTDWHGSGTGDTVSKGLKALFADVRKRAERGPVILFVDELDSMGTRGGHAHNDSWFRPIVNAWLAFLDGAEPRDGVVVIGATNMPDAVDAAMLRPGRLETHVEIQAPTITEIAGIVLHHAPGVHDGVEGAARACRGLSAARIAMVCREARRAARQGKRSVTSKDIVAAAAAGRPVRPRVEDEAIALHEAAHALIAVRLDMPLISVDLDAAAARLGPKSSHDTREKIEAQIAVFLAGRIANGLYGDGPTAGAEADLVQATALAMTAVTRYGMGGRLSVLSAEAAAIDPAVRREVEGMLWQAEARARELLGDKRTLFALRDALVERRYLDGNEVHAICSNSAPRR